MDFDEKRRRIEYADTKSFCEALAQVQRTFIYIGKREISSSFYPLFLIAVVNFINFFFGFVENDICIEYLIRICISSALFDPDCFAPAVQFQFDNGIFFRSVRLNPHILGEICGMLFSSNGMVSSHEGKFIFSHMCTGDTFCMRSIHVETEYVCSTYNKSSSY